MLTCKTCGEELPSIPAHFDHFAFFHKVNSKSWFTCGWQNCSGKLYNVRGYNLHVDDFHNRVNDENINGSVGQSQNGYKCPFPNCQFVGKSQGTIRGHRFWKHSKDTLTHLVSSSRPSEASARENSSIDFNFDLNEEETCNVPSSPAVADNLHLSIPLSAVGVEELIEKKFVHHCLSLTSKFHIPDSTLHHMIRSYDLMFQKSLEHSSIVLSEALQAQGLSSDCITEIVKKVIFSSKLAELHSPAGPMRSYYMRKEQYKKFPYVAPQQKSLGLDEFNKPAVYHYVNIEDSLKMFFNDNSVFEQYVANRRRSVLVDDLYDIMDGVFLKNHPLFSVDSSALQLILYHDDIQVCNGMGPDASKYKITHMSYTLGNLHPWNRTKVDPIQLLLLCKEKYVDYFGYEKVLKPIITSLKKLESVGIEIRGEVVKAGVAVLLGDNKGTHCICGLTEGFSRGEFFCRYCEESRKAWVRRVQRNGVAGPEVNENDNSSDSEMSEDEAEIDDPVGNGDVQVVNDSDDGEDFGPYSSDDDAPLINLVPLRTLQVSLSIPDNKAPRRTAESCQECYNRLSDHPGGVKGIVGSCEFNKLESFHFVRATPPCLAHDLLEGVIPFDLLLCIKQLSKEYKFSYDFLNCRIKSFTFQGAEELDKPPAKFDAKMKKVKGNAVQNWVFLRFLPLLIGDKISDKAHPVWKMVLTLIEFVTIVTSPVISTSILPYMKALFKKYLYFRTSLFPHVPLRCKHHYVEHYDELTKMYGPLSKSSTLRFESKHKFFREEIRAKKNVKNPTLTASVAHQKMQSSLTIENLFEMSPVIKNPVQFCNVDVHPAIRQLILGKFGNEVACKLLFSHDMTVHNVLYVKDRVVVVSSDNYPNLECLKINVLFSDGRIGYAAGFQCAASLNPDVMVHCVKITAVPKLIFLHELKDFIPYSLYSYNGRDVIVLKHLYIRK